MRDQDYMMRCLELAQRGEQQAAPNPMVGAVVVHEGKIIGEGYHRCCGEAHAEVNALAAVRDEHLLKEATIYVSLEPCSHYGKTPPCAELIIQKGLRRVVVGMVDPNPQVSGRGISMLRAAGIEVEVGVLEAECRAFNRRFICYQQKKRPYVLLKWAQSSDGFIDLWREDNSTAPVRISNEITKATNHYRRVCESAIMVARRTAELDNPKLTASKWDGPNPTRVLLDRHLKVPQNYAIYNRDAKSIIINEKEERVAGNIHYVKIDFCHSIVPQILDILYKHHITSVIVEGGTQLLNSFIESNLWDECQVERAPILLGSGVNAPVLHGQWMGSEMTEENEMSYWRNRNIQTTEY